MSLSHLDLISHVQINEKILIFCRSVGYSWKRACQASPIVAVSIWQCIGAWGCGQLGKWLRSKQPILLLLRRWSNTLLTLGHPCGRQVPSRHAECHKHRNQQLCKVLRTWVNFSTEHTVFCCTFNLWSLFGSLFR